VTSINQDLLYYAQDSLWEHPDNDDQLIVARDIVSLMPKDVDFVLDAGCGKGTVTNLLAKKYSVVGIDVSAPALSYVNTTRVQGDICNLPFADESFDLVVSSDVIEHIPENLFLQSLAELLRISKRYILISVPFNEILESSFTSCIECHHVFHINWHQRSFNAEKLETIFGDNAGLIDYKFSGAKWKWSDVDLVKLKNKYAGYHREHNDAICPECEVRQRVFEISPDNDKKNYIERSFEALNHQLTVKGILDFPCSSEIIALYDKEATNKEHIVITQPKNVERFSEVVLCVNDVPRVDYIPNYPTSYMIASIYENSWVLVLPHSCNEVELVIENGTTEGKLLVEIYDYVEQKYYPLYQYAQYKYIVSSCSPSMKGYYLKFNCSLSRVIEIKLI
jgi:SAM-dependent methyltransferase